MTALVDRRTSPASELTCRNCGASYPLGPQHACFECFGPLEISYDADALARVTRADIEAGPHSLWRYAGLLPVGQDLATRVDSGTGMTPLIRADRLGAELGLHRAAVGQGRLGQPDALVQGPRRVGRRHRRPRTRLRADRVRVDGQPGQLRRRTCRAHRHAVHRVRPGRPRVAEDRAECDLRRHAGRHRGFLRRRQPAVLGAFRDRRVREDRVRERQCPALLRRRIEDPRLRGRRAARLATARASTSRRWRPVRCSPRSPRRSRS